MAKKCIDVSYANNSIDWNKVKKSGIDYAILRSTFGSELPSQIDNQFFQNAQGCVKNGIPFGIYHFAYFINEQTARNEADFAINKANEYKSYIKFIALDIEEDSERYAKSIGANPDYTKCAIAFLERVKAAGYIPVIYTNQSWITYKYDWTKLNNYKLWYAAPGSSAPKYSCAIWQYSWDGKVDGINGDVDLDYVYDDSLFTTAKSETKTTSASTATSALTDKEKFLTAAKSYIGKNGYYVCCTKLNIGAVYDWCAFAVSSIMNDCGFVGKYINDIQGGAGDIPRYSDGKYGTWFEKGTISPESGDLIFFRYAGALPTDKYFSSHVGIVESVAGSTITTLEGNVEGVNGNWANTSTFKRKTRMLGNSDVYAFYRPNWGTNTKTTATGSNTKKAKQPSNTVSISQISSSQVVSFKVKVESTNGVNIRCGAATSYTILGAVPYGTVLKVTRKTSGGGYTWGLVEYNNIKGWIALEYTKIVGDEVQFKIGDKVKVAKEATVYGTNSKLSSFVFNNTYQIVEISGNRVVIGINGQITAAVDKKYLIKT